VWFALLVLYALTKLYLAYRVSESEEKRRIEHLFLGLAIGFTGGSFSFLPVFNVNLYPHLNSAIAFGYLIVGYAILKHKLMDIRVIATQWFVAALWVVIFARVILSPPGSEEQFFNIFLLAMTVIIGAFLVRSVIREIRQRERIEQLARKLRWTNRRLEQVNMRLQRANVKLAAANEQLATLDKAKSEFLSIASHQLYTPLTAIKGYLSMIMEGDFGKVPSRLRPIIDRVFRSSERLIQLIRGLLDISRIESGRLQLNLESVDLGMVAEELCQELVPKAQEKNLKFACHVRKAKLPSVVVDRQRIRQVLLNIVDNAIKYTETGRVDVYVRREGDDILFYVKDTGRGMTQREIARLFHKFTRLGGADKYHTEGAGLGLYVARRIVEEHHGKIWAESRGHGKGSTFYVRLPIEGTPRALKVGEKAEVQIKPAEVGGK
jgi:signal transduction histidine kinase